MPEPGSKRGRTHDAEGSREAILDAAEQVFAEHGFDGARIDAIAKTAGYNKSLIFQYYGDKLKLYAEVMRRADEQTRWIQTQALPALEAAESDPDWEKISALFRSFIGAYYDYLLEHPRIMRMFLWEMAEGWQTYAKIISQRDFDDMALFGPLMERMQTLGLFRSKLNPVAQMFTAVFVVHNYLGTVPINQIFLPAEDFTSAEAQARAREYVIEFVVHGMLADPTESRSYKSE
jgi:TetR/AcrR family transcriptional regulator